MLLSRTPAPSTGFASQIFNGGEIRNRGLEVVLGLTPIQKRDFNWIASTSLTYHRSKVLSLPVPPFRPPASGFGGLGVLFIEEGKSLTRIFGPRFAADGTTVEQADVGDTEPSFRLGFQNSFSYKALSVSFTADYQNGGTVTNLTQLLYDDGQTTADFGSAAHAKRLHDFFQNGVITPYIEDADFFKLREVSINWTLPRSWTDALGWGIKDARLGLTGRDLFWWTKYSGLDPEVANFGAAAIRSNVDVTPYPPSRSIFINLAVGF